MPKTLEEWKKVVGPLEDGFSLMTYGAEDDRVFALFYTGKYRDQVKPMAEEEQPGTTYTLVGRWNLASNETVVITQIDAMIQDVQGQVAAFETDDSERATDEAETHFGRGFVVCLLKIFWHTTETTREGDVSRGWFVGARQHLDGLQIPEQFEGTELEKKVGCLIELIISTTEDNSLTRRGKVDKLLRDIAMEIDKELGLEPDAGEYR